jgi:hypothetical protein
VLTENLVHHEVCQPHHQPVMDSSYTNFLATYPSTFTEASDPLEVDNMLHIAESKFRLPHCTKF